MTGTAALARHSLRRWRGLLLTMSIVLAIFQIFMILTAREYEKSGLYQQVQALTPAFMQEWTNMTLASFRGLVLFGYIHPLVQLFLIATAIAIGTEPATEVESKFVDLLLARPIPRAAVVHRTAIVLVTAIVTGVSSMLVGTWSGLRLFAPPGAQLPSSAVVLSLAANLSLLVLAWGTLALALGTWSKRRATAATVCGFLAFAAFVLDYAGRFWSAIEPLSRISPFHYFDPFAIMGGRAIRWSDVAALVGIALVSGAIAHVAYQRRDL